jgi:pimeloyl-ACP methyl ester carboxylesterase
MAGDLVSVGDTRLYVESRGKGFPLMILHGGPGLDHTMFGDYLDPLADSFRLLLIDQRSQGRSDRTPVSTWSLLQMARDVSALAGSLGLERYAVLGHSYGAFVALQHAVDFPNGPAATIVSSGVPSARYLEDVDTHLASFQPQALREQVQRSWEKEKTVETADGVAGLLHEQMPFHFRDPLDPRISEYERRAAGGQPSPEVLRHFANLDYGGIEVEDRLRDVAHPVLVLAGRYDRVCSVPAAQAMATGISDSRLVVFENSGHMTFVEEHDRYLDTVRAFLAPFRG